MLESGKILSRILCFCHIFWKYTSISIIQQSFKLEYIRISQEDVLHGEYSPHTIFSQYDNAFRGFICGGILFQIHSISISDVFVRMMEKRMLAFIFRLAVLASVYGVCSSARSPGGNHLYLQSLKPPHTRNFQNFHFIDRDSIKDSFEERGKKNYFPQNQWKRNLC